jgi:predicted glycoside hydrolase/deacetylase ChbG (UPF0249 family)
VVNADDFGLCQQINNGILQAHQQGIVTSTSLMAVGKAFAHAIDCCRSVPTLDVGVHLTAVAARPLVSSCCSLTDADGNFPTSAGTFTRRWLRGAIRGADLQAEWSAQIECILDEGIRLTHLDSHQHLHILPGLTEICQQLALRFHIPFIRVPVESLLRLETPSLHGCKRMAGATILGGCWLLGRLVAHQQPLDCTLRFLGFHDGGQLDQKRLLRMLRSLRPGRRYELMCHPGHTPDEPDIQDWKYHHATELQALTDPLVLAEIKSRAIRLCSFADLADQQPVSKRPLS